MATEIIPAGESFESGEVHTDGPSGLVEIGQWYWVRSDRKDKDEWLGCVVEIGSNYVELSEPRGERGRYVARVHFDNFQEVLRFEPNAQAVITGKIGEAQELANKHLAEVKAITARLGIYNGLAVEHKRDEQSTSLVAMSSTPDIGAYKAALIKAQKEDLPALFQAIKTANAEVARWMSAETLPMMAMAEQMQGSIKQIEGRIFNVSLYAGLTEDVVLCHEGEPAAYDEKLHLMQRRAYMDEECLLDYRHGGMEFKNIEQFDAWLAEPQNLTRILPFPRCAIAMRVRRLTKYRDSTDMLSAYINMQLGDLDRLTFLYIRNGDRLYRMNCDLDFGELTFPDKATFTPDEPMMFKMFASRVDGFMTVNEYEKLCELEEVRKAKSAQWMAEHPDANEWSDPHRSHSSSLRDWQRLDKSSVYFDEAMQVMEERIKQYNRIALIIQGLFDRSEVLHPHPPVKSWTPEGFAAAIELVYDGSDVLADGDAPDFEAYRAQCNASLTTGSVVVGQERHWMEKEAEKECARRDRNWRDQDRSRPALYRPYGNPGPGYIARIAQWQPRARQAVFAWNRDRQKSDAWSGKHYGDPLRTTLTVPADRLFNASAYQLGDYKRFFQDSRTRAQYLRWAPMLLAAEEYQNGTACVQEPV